MITILETETFHSSLTRAWEGRLSNNLYFSVGIVDGKLSVLFVSRDHVSWGKDYFVYNGITFSWDDVLPYFIDALNERNRIIENDNH